MSDLGSHVDLKTGRPVEVEGSRYEDGEELVWPSAFGVTTGMPCLQAPDTGLVYLPDRNAALFKDSEID